MNYNIDNENLDKQKDIDKHKKEDIKARARKNQSSKNAVIKKGSKESNIFFSFKKKK